jgi:glucose/arabinose dehydrogenase
MRVPAVAAPRAAAMLAAAALAAAAADGSAEGWLQGESVCGRPVDIEVMRNGSLLVSDDHTGAIYRISYRGRAPAANYNFKHSIPKSGSWS